MILKNSIFIIILIIVNSNILAQHIKVKSFCMLEKDVDARITNTKTDQNGQKTAILKIVTNERGFVFEGGIIGIVATEQKNGEVWLWIPPNAKRITIKHKKYGVLRNYIYPKKILEGTVYKMELEINQTISMPVYGSLKIQTTPIEANIKLNGENMGTTPNTFRNLLIGDYKLALTKPGYATVYKNIRITENHKTVVNENMEKGVAITIIPEPASAQIYIDSVYNGTGTIIESLSFGSHSIKLTGLKKYSDEECTIIITKDGQTNYTLKMQPCITDNRDGKSYRLVEIGQQVWMAENLAYKASNGCWVYDDDSSNIAKYGYLYNWETARTVCPNGWHLPTRADYTRLINMYDGSCIELKPGGKSGFSALFGGERSTYGRSDDKYYDEIGEYCGFWTSLSKYPYRLGCAYKMSFYEASCKPRIDYRDISCGLSVRCLQSIDEYEKDLLTAKVKLMNQKSERINGSLKIQTIPIDAIITLNGMDMGLTPKTLSNVLIGHYRLNLSKTGYATVSKTISITENQETFLSETMEKGLAITIIPEPVNAHIFIDSVYKGVGTITESLSLGNHTIRLASVNKYLDTESTITIAEGGQTTYTLKMHPNSLIDSRDGKSYRLVKIGQQVWMAKNLAYKTSSGCWAYNNDSSNVARYGYLYDWKTAKKVCPRGWHLPTVKEFATLFKNVGGSNSKAYQALLPSGSSGFLAQFGGYYNDCRYQRAYFWGIGMFNVLYSSSKDVNGGVWKAYIRLYGKEAGVKRARGIPRYAYSVRCLKNN